MCKKRIPLCLSILLLSALLFPQQAEELIKEIVLIHNPVKKYSTAPAEIRIGVDMAAPAFYKLLSGEAIVSAGLLSMGINSLSIPVQSYFEKTAKHTLILELKTEKGLLRKDIVIEVQLGVLETPKKVEPEVEIREHRISLYIEDELVSTRIKQEQTIPEIQTDLAKIKPSEGPFSVPKEFDDVGSSRVDILTLLGVAYQLAKSAIEKKKADQQGPILQYTHSCSIKYLRTTPLGVKEEVIAMIGLTTK